MAEYRYEEYHDGSPVPVCLTQASNVWNITYFLMTISAFFILPLLILVVLYTIIAKNLISKDGRMVKIRPSKPELSFKARKQVVLMLGAVVLSFFICLLPFRIFTLWIIIASDETVKSFGVENYYNCLYFSRIMLYLNSAINPILYNLMSSKFRKGFQKLCFSCLWSRRRQHNGRGRLATLNTTTTTTTTSSFNSHSVSKKISAGSAGRTVSLDDLRTSNYSSNKPIESKLNEWRRCNAVNGLDDSPDKFRKIAIKNASLLRQKSSLSTSCDESSGAVADTSSTGMALVTDSVVLPATNGGASGQPAPRRQISVGHENDSVPLNSQHRKKKLQFQYSLDDEKDLRLQYNGMNKRNSDDQQPSVPFLS